MASDFPQFIFHRKDSRCIALTFEGVQMQSSMNQLTEPTDWWQRAILYSCYCSTAWPNGMSLRKWRGRQAGIFAIATLLFILGHVSIHRTALPSFRLSKKNGRLPTSNNSKINAAPASRLHFPFKLGFRPREVRVSGSRKNWAEREWIERGGRQGRLHLRFAPPSLFWQIDVVHRAW